MKKAVLIVLMAVLLLGPSVPLLAVSVVMNPAAKGTCVMNSGLTVGQIPDSLTATTKDGTRITLNKAQLTHAATIITVGSRVEGTNRDAIVIALMSALTESTLRMLSNTSAYPESADYPNDGDGGDHDSLGLFQMRHQSGWGSVADLMDPNYQVRAFMGGPTGPNYPSPRGLLDITGWKTMDKGAAAQAVEVSAYPDRYANYEPVANSILAALAAPGTGGGPSDGSAPETSAVVFPLPAGTWVLSSPFGYRIHPITHVRTFHAGTDYGAADGTPILATADGTVTFAGHRGGYGNAILINHTVNGKLYASLYGHMWDGHLYVKAGDHVVAGQHIADVGSNGRSTGPHLHFEIRPDNDYNKVTDAHAWLAAHGAATLDGATTGPTGCYLEGGN
ncbi:MAG: M23 family metallopeptidase [Bifidobacteriaceae bacterium]|jgi:murein DD-endopeptidase MepM/ murein hydrolase activator NlpD|nr:M23 family metallopeptidase [Bifidobacteriaceae bacterium]